MASMVFDAIDWQQPWLKPLLNLAEQCKHRQSWRFELNRISSEKHLLNHSGLPIRFVDQEDLPPGMAYESFISETGKVPTRNNLHDFFNAMIWLTFPKAKAQLNAVQAAEIIKAKAALSNSLAEGGQRGGLRDAATIFDESAALFITSDIELVDALRVHAWRELFLTRRAAFGTVVDVCLFGHALFEKLVTPFKAITAHSRLVVVEPAFFSLNFEEQVGWLDTAIAYDLQNEFRTADFMPLPVLGIPGWARGQDVSYYDDTTVFRPKRKSVR